MFKRLFWFTLGTGVGATGTMWLVLRLRHALLRMTPGGVPDELTGALRRVGAELRAVAAEGRLGMEETERRLRAQLEPDRALSTRR